jgi:hypothetical protein
VRNLTSHHDMIRFMRRTKTNPEELLRFQALKNVTRHESFGVAPDARYIFLIVFLSVATKS